METSLALGLDGGHVLIECVPEMLDDGCDDAGAAGAGDGDVGLAVEEGDGGRD